MENKQANIQVQPEWGWPLLLNKTINLVTICFKKFYIY